MFAELEQEPSHKVTAMKDKLETPSAEPQLICYEFPLNERIRSLLRLEDLFNKFEFFVSQDHRLDHHTALLSLFEIVEVGSRADIKSDLMQELDRQKQTLGQFLHHPNVDRETLRGTLTTIDTLTTELNQITGRLGYHLRDNEFLMIIRSRSTIPGGVCEFDLPRYHRWQSRPPEHRRQDLQSWYAPMRPLAKAAQLALRILRESGETHVVTAEQGSFTQPMNSKAFQLLKIDVPAHLEVIPEFSANKYMLWVRFNIPNVHGVSKNTYPDPVQFKFRLCNF